MKKFFFGAKKCRKFFQVQDNVPVKGRELLQFFQKPKGFDNGDIKYYGHRDKDMDGASRKQKRMKAKEKSEMKDFLAR